jgi:hypothetical protein
LAETLAVELAGRVLGRAISDGRAAAGNQEHL